MSPDYSMQIAALMPTLMRYARRLCRNAEDDAADLSGETVCRVLERIHQYDPSKNTLRGFCAVVMRNLFIVDYNRRKLRLQIPNDNQEISGAAELSHDYHLIRTECRKVEVMMYAAGYTCSEIAAKRGIPVSTVRTRIFYERERLAGIMDYNASTANPRKGRGRPPRQK